MRATCQLFATTWEIGRAEEQGLRGASGHRWRALWVMLAVIALVVLCADRSPARAQSFGTNVLGWCTTLLGTGGLGTPGFACFGDPMSACQAQHDSYAPQTVFIGFHDRFRWDSKGCDWETHLGVIFPAGVDFECDIGYTPLPGEMCVKGRLNQQTKRSACNADNGGSGPLPSSDGPINFLFGSKEFTVTDFATNDGALTLTRLYNSREFGGAVALSHEPLGLGRNWRFFFQHELQLNTRYGSFRNQDIELESAGGEALGFLADSSGHYTPNHLSQNGGMQTDYTVAFVGTWPSNPSQITASSSQWSVQDPQNRTWLFQTFLNPDSGFYDIGLPINVSFAGGLQWTFQYGPSNELLSITDSFGKQLTFTWIYRDPSTLGVVGFPVRPQAISSVNLPDGTSLHYSYSPLNPTATTLPQAGRMTGVAHLDATSAIIDQTTYLYEDPINPYGVTGILDRDGTRRWTVTYDTAGRATSSSGPGGVDQTTVSYSPPDTTFVRTVTNALGKSATYTFPEYYFTMDNRLSRVDGIASTHCPASAHTYTYGSDNFFATTTDEEGRVTSYTHDPRGMPTSITRGYGTAQASTTSTSWHPTFRVPTQIVQPGLTTDLTWNSLGQLTQLTQTDTTTQSVPYATNGQTRTWSYTYTATGGYLATVDGPLPGTGDTVTYAYSAQGYLQSVTDEVGLVTRFTAWNGRGQPTSMIDANNVVTTYSYDGLGRLTGIATDPTGINAIWSFTYDAVGDITRVTRPNGAYLQYTWDTARRLTTVTDNTGATINYLRDLMGHATSRTVKDAGGNIQQAQTATFDELGRLLTLVGAASQTWTTGYDKTDNQVSVTDPRSNVYRRGFDPLNRLISETDEDSSAVNLTRNGKDEVTAYQDPRSLTTTYVRNGFGDVIQRTSPDTGTAVYQYDARGKATSITDGRGVVTNLTYDNAGRLTSKQYQAAPAENITYTWDETANGTNGAGRITTITDASGSVQWAYDTLGRVIRETKTTAGVTYTIGYGYDAAGNITQITYPSGRIVTYARDAVGRVAGVTMQAGAASGSVTVASNVSYQPFGPLASLTFGNGNALSSSFTGDYLINEITVQSPSRGQSILDRVYGRSDSVNITDITDDVDATRTESYWYTPTNRLQNATGPYGQLTYYYDGVGNRTYEIVAQGGSTTTNIYNYPSTSNVLSSVTQGSATVRSFTTDGAGNVTADNRSGTAYAYDYNNRGRLNQVTAAGNVLANYTYDGLERMAIRTTQNMTPSGTTHYLYDLSGRLIAEASSTGTTITEYVWVDDLPLAVIADVDTASPSLWYVHADHLNRPIKMTDGAGVVLWDAVYWPFGAVYAISGSATNNMRFPGQYFLLEAGLHYNWHRHYDPTLGRYVQPDPSATISMISAAVAGPTEVAAIAPPAVQSTTDNSSIEQFEFMDGPSIYAYSTSNPIVKVDQRGLSTGSFTPVPGSSSGRGLEKACQVAQIGGTPLDARCRRIKAMCIDECIPHMGRDTGPFFYCIAACMARNGCPSVHSE